MLKHVEKKPKVSPKFRKGMMVVFSVSVRKNVKYPDDREIALRMTDTVSRFIGPTCHPSPPGKPVRIGAGFEP